MKTLTSQMLVEAGLSRGGSRTAIVDGERRLSFAAVGDRSARLAHALRGLGADLDHPVALLLGNRAEYIEADLAATRAGVPRVGLSERLTPDEWHYILADSEAAVLIVAEEYRQRMLDLPDTVRGVLVLGAAAPRRGPRVLDYERALAEASSSPPDVTAPPEAPNFIMYTSGTTGRPKGSWHSNAARAAAAMNMLSFELAATSGSGMLHVAPLTHGSGSKVLSFFALGARNIVLPGFDLEAAARAAAVDGATHTFWVPTMIQRLLDAPAAVRADLRRLSRISFGGAPIAPSVFREAVDVLGRRFVQVYGSCEAPHPVSLLRPDDYAAGMGDGLLTSAGYASPAVRVRIRDADGAELGAGEIGELEVRAPHLMSGYWRNPEATAQVMDAEGWYASGDLATRDEFGLLTLQDRKRDIIISGGLNVYPSEVERVLLEHPRVRQAAVVGRPDEEWGESVHAFVVARGVDEPTGEELTAWVKDRLASYKKPTGYEFCAELPLGSSHKVLRRELRDRLWKGRSRGVN